MALVEIKVSGIVPGSQVYIAEMPLQQQLINTQAAGSSVSVWHQIVADVEVIIRVRKAASSPEMMPFEMYGTVSAKHGLDATVCQVHDEMFGGDMITLKAAHPSNSYFYGFMTQTVDGKKYEIGFHKDGGTVIGGEGNFCDRGPISWEWT